MGAFALPARTVVRNTKPSVVASTEKTVLCLQRTPFGNLCRDIVFLKFAKDGLRFASQALLSLQEATEAHIINHLTQAARIVAHYKRGTVNATDLKLVHTLDSEVEFIVDEKDHNKLQTLPKANLLRLFRAAGVERASSDLYAETERCIIVFLTSVLQNVTSVVMSRRTASSKTVSPTVSAADVSYSLANKVYGLAATKR